MMMIDVTQPPFSAVPNGQADCWSALQGALDIATNGGGTLYLPAGNYPLSKPLIVAGPAVVQGDGFSTVLRPEGVMLSPSGARVSAMLVASSEPVLFRDFMVRGVDGRGAAICIDPPGSFNIDSLLSNVKFSGGDAGVDVSNAGRLSLDRCIFEEQAACGVRFRNVKNPDIGDSSVANCTFTGDGRGQHLGHVFIESSGGLRIWGCKMNGGDYGVSLAYDAQDNTSILLISGCSIEGWRWAGVNLQRARQSGLWYSVTVTGCEIAGRAVPPLHPERAGVWSRAGGPVLGLVVQGNTFVLSTVGESAARLEGGQNVYMGSNSIVGPAGTWASVPGPGVAIQWGPNACYGGVSPL